MSAIAGILQFASAKLTMAIATAKTPISATARETMVIVLEPPLPSALMACVKIKNHLLDVRVTTGNVCVETLIIAHIPNAQQAQRLPPMGYVVVATTRALTSTNSPRIFHYHFQI